MLDIKYKELTQEEAKRNLDENMDILLVDVREVEEFNAGHIEGAELIPLGEVEEAFANMDIDKDTEIYLYCRSGRRSEVATLALADMGFTNAYNIGGVLDWKYGLVK
ncbi:rhodanese-like domain-containing protein [Clostridium mediterraneense]|uniref:rhodanese-like domain-containing protein n=1 Tax=Clostridium mediterraneense TaxID=1805472 RepID=UPI00082ACB92|nr:rhodanese-like domain-containing protein [Clostridium mediterraneense]